MNERISTSEKEAGQASRSIISGAGASNSQNTVAKLGDGLAGGPTRSTGRAIAFRLGAVLIALLPFVLLEGALRLLDVGRPARADDLAGFNGNPQLFERHGAVYRTAAARQPFFSYQEFAAEKPVGSLRIFCLGGSTVYGHPYQSDTAFPKWLELELAATHPAGSWQAINCGGVSYASFRLTPLVKEVLQYQPDLVILATGENEFLEERTYHSIKDRSGVRRWLENAALSLRMLNVLRNWSDASAKREPKQSQNGTLLSQEVQPKLDERSGYASYHRDDEWRKKVCSQFEQSLRAMVTMCQRAGVPIILVKLGSNLRDCPPFKSEHKPGLSPEQEAAWEAAFEAGTAAEAGAVENSALRKALEFYRRAEVLDPEFALLAFRIGRVLERLGQKKEALQYYLQAKESDVCPLRLIRANEEILEKLAAEKTVPLVDAAALLAANSLDQIPGNDHYLDHVHPNIGGHQQIARAIAARMQSAGIILKSNSWPEEQRQKTYAEQFGRLSRTYLADGRRRVEWLENWARRQRLFEETLPKDAEGWLRLGLRRLELDDDEGARHAFEQSLQREPKLLEMLRKCEQELLSEGSAQKAEKLREIVPNASRTALPGKQ